MSKQLLFITLKNNGTITRFTGIGWHTVLSSARDIVADLQSTSAGVGESDRMQS